MSRNYKIFILVLVVLLSLVGGIIGGMLVRSYFLNSSFNVPLFGDINLGGQYQSGSLVISQPKKVIVEQDDRIAGVIEEIKKDMVVFYKKKSTPEANQKTEAVNAVVKNYYSPSDIVGEGMILTSDGWIITPLNIANPQDFTVISEAGDIFDITEAILDKTTNYFFVKVSANNLAVAQFNEKLDVSNGQVVINLNNNIVDISYVRSARFDTALGGVKSSETYYNKIKISQESFERGSVVAGLNGHIFGLYEKDGLVTPMYQFNQALTTLLSDKKIIRPTLGINYLNLYDLKGEDDLEGILVSKNTGGVFVTKGGAADKAGILLNDQIIEMDGIKINTENSFSEAIQGRKSGDNIELTIVREGKEQNIIVMLE